MSKKIYIIAIFYLIVGMILVQETYAKYIMHGNLEMNVYIDKTPPIINVTTNGETDTFEKTQTDIVKRTEDVTIDTSDNIQIKNNEYYYNPSDSNFDNLNNNKFENGEKLTEEGFYKIKAEDTSGNITEIIILLDKSAPDIKVQYFKKGEERSMLQNSNLMRQVSAIRKSLASEEIIDTNNVIDNDIVENVIHDEISENTIKDSMENTEEIIEKTEKDSEGNAKDNTEEIMEQTENTTIETINDEIAKDLEPTIQTQSNIDTMVMSARAGEIFVGNEAEFRNGLAMQASVIRIRDSIDFGSPVVVNYPLTIVRESDSNALRYGNGGNFIIVQAGGSLTLDGVVVDTNSSGNGGMTAINIENGGAVTFVNSSIVDRTDWEILEYW